MCICADYKTVYFLILLCHSYENNIPLKFNNNNKCDVFRTVLMDNLYSYSFLLLALFITTNEAIQCYSCDDVVEARECSRLITCGSHEICYSKRKIGSNLQQYYELGCMDRNVCLGQQVSMFAMGKRDTIDNFLGQIESNSDKSRALQSRDKMTRDSNGDMNLCTKCCEKGDGCNKDLCGSPPRTNLRCLSCNDVYDTKNCEKVRECGRNEFCFVHKGVNSASYEMRYDLGCMGLLQCAALKNVYTTLCLVCCNHTDFCNYDACENWSPAITQIHAHTHAKHPTTTAKTMLPPPKVAINGLSKSVFLQKAELACVANPAADTFQWKFNGSLSLPNGVNTHLISGQTGSGFGIDILHISNLTESTFGTYTCVVSANGQTGEQSHFLGIIGEKPTVHIEKPPVTSSFAMQCKVTGYPTPHIQWDFISEAHGSHGIPSDVEFNNAAYESTLFVKQYKPIDHTGRWICKAYNTEGAASGEVHVP